MGHICLPRDLEDCRLVGLGLTDKTVMLKKTRTIRGIGEFSCHAYLPVGLVNSVCTSVYLLTDDDVDEEDCGFEIVSSIPTKDEVTL